MFKTVTSTAAAIGLILFVAPVLGTAAEKQTGTQMRTGTENEEMLQKGTPGAGEQEQVRERARIREEEQTRESGTDAKQYRKQGAQDAEATVSGDQLKDQDRLRDRDKDLDQLKDQDRLHDRDRIHTPSAAGSQSGGSRR